MPDTQSLESTPKWQVLELVVESPSPSHLSPHDARLIGVFTSPAGQSVEGDGFWDGGGTWRIRFAPEVEGRWQYSLNLAAADGETLVSSAGAFLCTEPSGASAFALHGPLRVDAEKRHLAHADGTPFFWLADTAWNGPLCSTAEEWQYYLRRRSEQGFNAVQWVTTQWRAKPDGDIEGRLAYSGLEHIEINPAFFQRLDRRVQAVAQAGMLNVPVLLWAIGSGSNPDIDPGHSLPEDQAILLAKYMTARWGAYPVVWILAGDGRYFGENAARWRRIGRQVFSGRSHAPVAMHCGGEQWPAAEFCGEDWLDILGYQSGHGDGEETLRWLVEGPPATEWNKEPRLFQINLETAYERHRAYQSGQPHSPLSVRRAIYSSLLIAPTAGVTYGGNGVWGWDDGTAPPVDHPNAGVPLPWRDALEMPAAQQMVHVRELFSSIEWQRLDPAPQLLHEQPGQENIGSFVLASASYTRDLAVVYTPAATTLDIACDRLADGLSATWFNPRTGKWTELGPVSSDTRHFAAPGPGDWLLLFRPTSA